MSDEEKFRKALEKIAATDWPINLNGESPQKIAQEALKGSWRVVSPPRTTGFRALLGYSSLGFS